MKDALRSWPFFFISLLLMAAVIFFSIHRASDHRHASADRLVSLLPQADAVVFYADVATLRHSDFLKLMQSAKGTQESDYSRFVAETGFDYERDLDALAAASLPNQFFAVARGRFDWEKLIHYAINHGGKCQNRYCRTPASQPGKWISFFPVRSQVLGLAVSEDPQAAYSLLPREDAPREQVPAFPVWARIPKRVLEQQSSAPPSLAVVTQALSSASTVTLGVQQSSTNTPGPALEIRLSAACDSPTVAANLRDHLAQLTRMLRSRNTRASNDGNPVDFGQILGSGTFLIDGETVVGQWLVPKTVLDALEK